MAGKYRMLYCIIMHACSDSSTTRVIQQQNLCVCVCVFGGGGSATIISGTYNIHDYVLNRLCLEARALSVPPKILVSS